MRNLTIKRTKSFVAALATMKVYMEDPVNGDITINGTLCRKLGELKNGGEQTFPIGTHAAKVYVIAGKSSRNYCNDYYPVPAGDEDVCLTGKNEYNISAGHPFRFDGVTDENVLANRKNGNRIGTVIVVIAALIGLLIGFAKPILTDWLTSNPKDFSGNGMSITLTSAFEETEIEDFTQCYQSKNTLVMALKEEFTLADDFEDYTVQEYGDLVIQANGMKDTQLKTSDGVVYFTYTSEGENSTYFYFAAVYKGSDAFWLVQFAGQASDRETLEPQFLQWAATVTVE